MNCVACKAIVSNKPRYHRWLISQIDYQNIILLEKELGLFSCHCKNLTTNQVRVLIESFKESLENLIIIPKLGVGRITHYQMYY